MLRNRGARNITKATLKQSAARPAQTRHQEMFDERAVTVMEKYDPQMTHDNTKLAQRKFRREGYLHASIKSVASRTSPARADLTGSSSPAL